MSLALADFLVDVADPEKLREYKAHPEPFMSAFNLTDGDKAAVRSGKGGWLRLQARLTAEEADLHSDHPWVIASGNTSALVEVEAMVENTTTNSNDLIAVDLPGLVVAGEDGRLYRVLDQV